MAQQMQNCQAVWHAFEKFLYRQVIEKSKSVDTQVMGIFKPMPEQVQYYPQPDFLELGKFKLKKQGIQQYREGYEKMKVSIPLTI